MADEWTSTSSNVFRFENVGASLEGTYMQVRDGQFFRPDGTKSKVFDIKAKDGTIYSVFGTMILERQMGAVKVGSPVKIVYKGKTKTRSGREANQFEVFTKG